MASVIEARLDQVEKDVLALRSQDATIHRRLDRRRHWWVTMFLSCLAMAIAAVTGSMLASRAVVHESRVREHEACVQRVEGREGIRQLIVAVLPLTPEQSQAHVVLSALLGGSLAPLPPCRR